MQDAVFFPRCTEPVYAPGGRRVLWRFGISGDYPLVALVVAEENLPLLKAYLMAFRALSVRGVRVELLLITEEDDLYNRPREKAVWSLINSVSCNGFIGRRGGIFVFSKQAFTDADFAYIRAHSSHFSEIYLFEREEASGGRTLAASHRPHPARAVRAGKRGSGAVRCGRFLHGRRLLYGQAA